MKCFATIAAVAAITVPGAAWAEAKRPPTIYWISVATGEGSIQGMPGMGGMMAGLMGGGMPGADERTLTLQLASPDTPTGAPRAAHAIPAGLRMGEALPLLSPEHQRAVHTPDRDDDTSTTMEKPRGRISVYWGCGATVRSGQPKVYDLTKMPPAEFGKAFMGRANRQRPPSASTARSYGEWPNRDSQIKVPAGASLIGDHQVSGNYTPDIRFAIGAPQDFMAPVRLRKQGDTAGAVHLSWAQIPTAIGQFTSVMASRGEDDMVIWSSAEIQEPGWALHDYLPSADVEKWVKDGLLMAPNTTTCTIPAGIFKEAGGAMLRFTAYGRELNTGWPEKPKDPVWGVKVRLKTTGMLMLDGPDMEHGATAAKAQPDRTDNPLDTVNAIIETGGALKGLFGR